MKKVLIGVLFVTLLAAAAAFVYRDEIGMLIAFNKLKPAQPFSSASSPASPDYAQPEHWAALPDREDAADTIVAGVQDQQKNAQVDVFFIHPTTYFGTHNWNQSLDDERVNRLTDLFVMRGQAATFNSCCRVYAPRYRQATIYSFVDRSGSGRSALQLAYGDVSARSSISCATTAAIVRSFSLRTARARCTCAN